MHPYHAATVHTYSSVRMGRELDWANQPDVFKFYADTYPAVALNDFPQLQDFFYLCAGLTARKEYPGGQYFLRVNPSAGALYPCELYVQVRNVAGLQDGIYHVETATLKLRLLYPLENDGLEAHLPGRYAVDGFIFLVTAVSHRSSWKYADRALRYCFLDSGHMLGSIEAACAVSSFPFSLVYGIDRDAITKSFGFSLNELVIAAAICGKATGTAVERLAMQLPQEEQSGQTNPAVLAAFEAVKSISGCKAEATSTNCYQTVDFITEGKLRRAITSRRSIRSFQGMPLGREHYEKLMQLIGAKAPSDCDENLRLVEILHRIRDMKTGIYDATLLREGDFKEITGYLCLEQALGADGAATFFIISSAGNYLPLMVKAGLIGQRIYLGAEVLGFSCSGIGAFYDLEVQEFLGTEDMICYAMAVGL